MNFIKQIERFQLLSRLISERKTGNPKELSERLDISRRQLYAYIDEFNDFGVKVIFSRKINSFISKDRKKLMIEFNIKVLDTEEKSNFRGGNAMDSISMLYLCIE